LNPKTTAPVITRRRCDAIIFLSSIGGCSTAIAPIAVSSLSRTKIVIATARFGATGNIHPGARKSRQLLVVSAGHMAFSPFARHGFGLRSGCAGNNDRELAKPEKGKYEEDDDNKAHDVNDVIHCKLQCLDDSDKYQESHKVPS